MNKIDSIIQKLIIMLMSRTRPQVPLRTKERKLSLIHIYSEYISGPGYQHVNGTQATAYARIRKIDSDFKRAERQRIVLSKVFEEAKSANIGTLLNRCV